MSSTFETVDLKVAEVEFFLGKMTSTPNKIEFGFYLSAYLSAARTTTLALQQFKRLPGFAEWYIPHQKLLKESALARFFLQARNEHAHGGDYPVGGGFFYRNQFSYKFSSLKHNNEGLPIPEDVVKACRKYFLTLLEIVYDCYVELGKYIDPQQYYTKENYLDLKRDINHAEGEIHGWLMQSYIDEGYTDDERWEELRGHVGNCEINHLFYSYLGKVTPQPEVPDYFDDFAYTPEEKGWIHVPAGFNSLEEYREAML